MSHRTARAANAATHPPAPPPLARLMLKSPRETCGHFGTIWDITHAIIARNRGLLLRLSKSTQLPYGYVVRARRRTGARVGRDEMQPRRHGVRGEQTRRRIELKG